MEFVADPQGDSAHRGRLRITTLTCLPRSNASAQSCRTPPCTLVDMNRAMVIAKWFVAWASADQADISNLKLQKLLYYAQGKPA